MFLSYKQEKLNKRQDKQNPNAEVKLNHTEDLKIIFAAEWKNCHYVQQVLPDFLCPPFPSPSPGDRWYLWVAMESDADR